MRAAAILLTLAVTSTAIAAPASPVAPPSSGEKARVEADLAETTVRLNRMLDGLDDVGAQARAMARIAWGDTAASDPRLAALARAKLVEFSHRSIGALREALQNADPRFSADIAAVLLEMRHGFEGPPPPDYLPALEEAIWFGNVEAQRESIPWAAFFGARLALLPAIDATLASPRRLMPLTLRTIPRFADDRCRFFLEDVLRGDDPALRVAAADALARTGGRALDVLRDAALADDDDIRLLAVDALLPYTGVDDLTTLYEYVATFRDRDDPKRVERIVERARQLESVLERQQAAEAATPGN